MAALARFAESRLGQQSPTVFALTIRIGVALRRVATGRYVEQRGRIERNGIAGMV